MINPAKYGEQQPKVEIDGYDCFPLHNQLLVLLPSSDHPSRSNPDIGNAVSSSSSSPLICKHILFARLVLAIEDDASGTGRKDTENPDDAGDNVTKDPDHSDDGKVSPGDKKHRYNKLEIRNIDEDEFVLMLAEMD